MPTLAVSAPFAIFPDIDGKPLDNGSIYIGVAGLSAALNPINVYFDEALTQLAPQPISTWGGYPVNNGVRCRLFVNSDYSIQVLNIRGTMVYQALESTDVISSDLVTFIQTGSGAVQRTVQDKLRDTVSVFDYMTAAQIADVRANTALVDVRAAVVTALAAAKNKALHFPAGTYLISNSIVLDSTYTNMKLFGDGAASVLKLGNNATNALLYFSGSSNIDVECLKFDGNGANQTSSSARCVRIERAASSISFNDVWFFNSYDAHVACFYTTGPVNSVSFTDCRFETTVRTTTSCVLLWNTENITFQGCYFTDWRYDAIACNFFAPTVAGGLVVDSCYFQNNNSTLFAIEFVAGDNLPNDRFYRIKNVNISNNIFDANNTTSGGSGISGWADYVSITGNTWRRSNGGTWKEGIEAAGNYWTISGNVFDDSRVVLASLSTASSGTNYIVTNNSIRVKDGDQRWGIQIGYNGTFDGVVVANNIIELINLTTPNTGGINVGTYDLSGVITNARITNNIISHDSLVLGITGIRLRGIVGSNNIVIDQNTLINFDVGIRSDSPAVATDVTISNNTLRNCNTNILSGPAVVARIFGNNYSANYALVSADRGDASVTIVTGVDAPTQIFNTPLTVNRTVTLSATNAFSGSAFKIVRTAAATGASTLSVGGLKTLAVGEYAEVQHNGTAWILTGFGAL